MVLPDTYKTLTAHLLMGMLGGKEMERERETQLDDAGEDRITGVT